MSDGANLENVVKLLGIFGKGIGYTGVSYDTFKQTLLWKANGESPQQVHVFQGSLHDVKFENLGFNRYVAVQLCKGKPAPAKPASNVLWVKLPSLE